MFQLGAIMSLVLSQTNLAIPTSCTLDLTKRPHCLPLPFRVPQRKTNLIYRYIHEHAKFLSADQIFFQIGDIVFAKLLNASVDMEPELVCVNSLGESAGLGQLASNGFVFTVPLHHIRK